jgi:hypothetical protein
MLCQDEDTGLVPPRLRQYVFPHTALETLKNGKWHDLPIVATALEIEQFRTGVTYKHVSALDEYTVAASLDYAREIGSRLFFALGYSLSPAQGKSFAEVIDVQKRAVSFARSLPDDEQKEWLTFLDKEFRNNCLGMAGALFLTKLSSGQPDYPEADIVAFVEDDCPYLINVAARLQTAEPIADIRLAFPSMFSAAPVALPGTSAARSTDPPDKDGKGKGKASDLKRKATTDGPGTKSGYAYVISDTEFFHTGSVFKIKEIADKYKLKPGACFAVLLSKKKGDEALQLCPEHASHGGMSAACHKRPANFNLDTIYKQFTRRPTPDELKAANWAPRKLSKA